MTPPRNPMLCLAIVVGLITIGIIGIAGMVCLEWAGRSVPASLAMAVGGAIAALAGRLGERPYGVPGADNGYPRPSSQSPQQEAPRQGGM